MPDQGLPDLNRLHRILAGSLGVIPWVAESAKHRMVRNAGVDQMILGHPLESWMQDPGLWFSHVHEQDLPLVREIFEATIDEHAPLQYEYRFLGRDGQIFWVRDFVEQIGGEGGHRFSGLMVNITNQKLSDLQLGVFDPLIRAVNESGDLITMFDRVLEHVCTSTGWILGQVWIPETESTFVCVACWSIQDRVLNRFTALSKDTVTRRDMGFIGTAFSMKSPLWTHDILRDLHFERGRVAKEAGLTAGVAIPVLSGDRAVAVMEFFVTERMAGDALLVEVVSAAGAQLGSAIHRKLTEAIHGNTSALLRAILRHSPNLIFVKDLEGRYLEVNDKFLNEFQLTRGQVIGRTDIDIFPKEQAELFRANDQKVLSTGVELEFEETAQYEDGLHVSIVHKFPLRDANGICYALGGIVTDITGRIRTKGQKG